MKSAATNHPAGESLYRASLSAEIVLAIRADYLAGASLPELSASYGANSNNIGKIIRGTSWRSVTGGTSIARPRHGGHTAGTRRLSMDQARCVRELYRNTRITVTELGRLLALSKNSVSDIVQHRSYREDTQ
jgi:hypothetical protein